LKPYPSNRTAFSDIAQRYHSSCGSDLDEPAPHRVISNTREANEWMNLIAYVGELCDRYGRDLGENAHSVLNAITEFASHPPLNRYVRRDRNSLQRLASNWLVDFSQRCRKQGFDLSQYLIELSKRDSKALGSPSTKQVM
jgi:hypothetical protein